MSRDELVIRRIDKILDQLDTDVKRPDHIPITSFDEIDVIDYPNLSEHPFDPSAAGQYFAVVSNRHVNLSRLGCNLDDFSYGHRLEQAIPMGYATLWVMQRASLVDLQGKRFEWPFELSEADPMATNGAFYILNTSGFLESSDDLHLTFKHYDDACDFAYRYHKMMGATTIVAMCLGSYQWH